jgi:hypothetical protein
MNNIKNINTGQLPSNSNLWKIHNNFWTDLEGKVRTP